MENNAIKGRVINKHDTKTNWEKTTLGEQPFIPKKGEFIIYDKEGESEYSRLKIGDGEQNVEELPYSISTVGHTGKYEDLIDTPNLDTKVDKVEPVVIEEGEDGEEDYIADYTIPAVDDEGNDVAIPVSISDDPDTLVIRNNRGKIDVPTPTRSSDAVNKKYVDDEVGTIEQEFEGRISEYAASDEVVRKRLFTIENLLSISDSNNRYFTETDSSALGDKSGYYFPKNVMPYAYLSKIAPGMSGDTFLNFNYCTYPTSVTAEKRVSNKSTYIEIWNINSITGLTGFNSMDEVFCHPDNYVFYGNDGYMRVHYAVRMSDIENPAEDETFVEQRNGKFFFRLAKPRILESTTKAISNDIIDERGFLNLTDLSKIYTSSMVCCNYPNFDFEKAALRTYYTLVFELKEEA